MTPLELNSVFLCNYLREHSLSGIHLLSVALIQLFLFMWRRSCHQNDVFGDHRLLVLLLVVFVLKVQIGNDGSA